MHFSDGMVYQVCILDQVQLETIPAADKRTKDQRMWQTDNEQYLKFRNGSVISSHTLLSMWLLIHAGIKVKPC